MKKLLGGVVVLLLAVVPAVTQIQIPRLFTRPTLPPADILDRLNLTMAWHSRVMTDGQQDGLFSLQLLPGEGSPQFVVQTLKGLVVMMDGETGDVLWQRQVAPPYWMAQPVAFNSSAVFVCRRDRIYSLDRATGRNLFQGLDAKSRQIEKGLTLPAVPSSTPVADELMLYVPLGMRVSAYQLPLPERKPGASAESELELTSDTEKPRPAIVGEPLHKWDSPTQGLRIERPLLLASGALGAITPGATFFSLSSLEASEPKLFKTDQPVTGALGQYQNTAYLASEDKNLYALSISSTLASWHFPTAVALFRTPAVTTKDIYLNADRVGLYCLDRGTGVARWLNKRARQFLAVNKEFVYATDPYGRLVILDYLRGTDLAVYDIRDYTVPYSNELTDRIYLGSHDGLIVCLRHRAQVTPLFNKVLKLRTPPDKAKEKKADEDKKGDEAKDKDDKKGDDPKDKNEETRLVPWARPLGALANEYPRAARPEPLALLGVARSRREEGTIELTPRLTREQPWTQAR
jgi:outer membrane protein assembly factor BamB